MHLRELPEGTTEDMDYREEIERLRRSSGIADVLPAEPAKPQSIPAFEMPAHAMRDSLLHSKSGFTNYRGLYNLALIMLVSDSAARFGFNHVKTDDTQYAPLVCSLFRAFVSFLTTTESKNLYSGRRVLCLPLAAGAHRNVSSIVILIVVFSPDMAFSFIPWRLCPWLGRRLTRQRSF